MKKKTLYRVINNSGDELVTSESAGDLSANYNGRKVEVYELIAVKKLKTTNNLVEWKEDAEE